MIKIDLRPVDGLIAYARNARTHSPEQIDQIAASIAEFGFTNPILADARGIVAGHGRKMAAEKLYQAGQTIYLPSGEELPAGTVPVIDCTGWSESQRRAYIIADNKHALNADWDLQMLRLELQDLDTGEIDLLVTGFSPDELATLMTFDPEPQDGQADPNESPQPRAEAVSKPGDIWILGDHRLACGSCTDEHTVSALLGDEIPHLMVTDPPYGVEYEAGWRAEQMPEKNDPSRWEGGKGAVNNDDKADWRDAWALFPGDVAYVWHASVTSHSVTESLIASDFELRIQIVWAKNQLVISRGHYHPQHELCTYAVRRGKTAHWNGDRKQSTVWRFVDDLIEPGEEVYVRRVDAELIYAISGNESTVWEIPKQQKSETGHPTQKPVECMRRPIVNNSKPGDAVYEPFSGSGTGIIAGEITGRRVFAIELDPVYVDVAVRRWQNFTGKQAILESTGETFPG